MLRTNRLRADTTVVEPNVAYPSESSPLAKGVSCMARAVARLQVAGLALQHDELVEVRQINAKLAQIAERAVPQVEQVVRNAHASSHRAAHRPGARVEITRLEQLAKPTRKIASQCRQRTSSFELRKRLSGCSREPS